MNSRPRQNSWKEYSRPKSANAKSFAYKWGLVVWYFSQHFVESWKEVGHLPAGFYLGYLRGRNSPPKKMPSFPNPPPLPPNKVLLSLQYISNYIEKSSIRDEVSAHTVIFLEFVSQNVPDCISAHIHFKKFPGEHVPGPPEEARRLRLLGPSPPNDKS